MTRAGFSYPFIFRRSEEIPKQTPKRPPIRSDTIPIQIPIPTERLRSLQNLLIRTHRNAAEDVFLLLRASQELGRHVPRGTAKLMGIDLSRTEGPSVLDDEDVAEVGETGVGGVVEEDVLGFEISM